MRNIHANTTPICSLLSLAESRKKMKVSQVTKGW